MAQRTPLCMPTGATHALVQAYSQRAPFCTGATHAHVSREQQEEPRTDEGPQFLLSSYISRRARKVIGEGSYLLFPGAQRAIPASVRLFVSCADRLTWLVLCCLAGSNELAMNHSSLFVSVTTELLTIQACSTARRAVEQGGRPNPIEREIERDIEREIPEIWN